MCNDHSFCCIGPECGLVVMGGHDENYLEYF